MIAVRIEDKEYSGVFTSINWSGTIKTSTRVVELNFLKGSIIEFDVGNKLELLIDSYSVFKGFIARVKTSSDEKIDTIVAFDNAYRLSKNRFAENFYQQTPSEIAKMILGYLKIEVGNFPQDKVRCDFPAWDKSGYDIILTAYKIQHNKDKKIYSIVSLDDKISVVEQGELIQDFTLVSGINIKKASYSKDLEEMINKVIVYEMKENKPRVIGVKTNEKDIEKYGVFQSVQEQDNTNEAYLKIQNTLKGVSESSELEVLGNVELLSGFSVAVKVTDISNLNGIFYIEEDNHTWSNGVYSTKIKLAFENIMNDIDVQTYSRKKPKPKKENTVKKKLNLFEVGGKSE